MATQEKLAMKKDKDSEREKNRERGRGGGDPTSTRLRGRFISCPTVLDINPQERFLFSFLFLPQNEKLPGFSQQLSIEIRWIKNAFHFSAIISENVKYPKAASRSFFLHYYTIACFSLCYYFVISFI